jgi:undecaprenyl diphosphate synthase
VNKTDLLAKIRDKNNIPKHVAIIMDGNRRWAKQNGLEQQNGHNFGAKKIEQIINIAAECDIKMLTLYAFSSENWNRSEEEVKYLMMILREYLASEDAEKLITNNIKFIAIGDLEKFDQDIVDKINYLQEKTKNNTKLILCLTLSYGGKAEIVQMVKNISTQVVNNNISVDEITEQTINKNMYLHGYPEPDLVIRTGGEQRISNFLLWYISYSELYFIDKMWPDFSETDFLLAIINYQLRKRRYGSI